MSRHIPYAAYLLSHPVVITTPGQYVTRAGEAVTVDNVSDYHWKRGTYSTGQRECWHSSGRIFSGQETANDIVGRG
jgi:hypothetical protein